MDITSIISAVHHVTGVTPEQMKENTRKGDIVSARQWVMYFATGNLQAIGDHFGRGHATVIHSRKTKANLMDVCRQTRIEHESIDRLIRQPEIMEMCVNSSKL